MMPFGVGCEFGRLGGDVKLVTIGIGDDTDGVHDCPKILDDEDVDSGPVYLQG